MAANWIAVKMPESVLAFTCPRAAISGAPPMAKPTRQPVMLKVFERLWNSIATSFAPGTCRRLGAGRPKVISLYAASCAITRSCSRASSTTDSKNGRSAVPPVGLLG